MGCWDVDASAELDEEPAAEKDVPPGTIFDAGLARADIVDNLCGLDDIHTPKSHSEHPKLLDTFASAINPRQFHINTCLVATAGGHVLTCQIKATMEKTQSPLDRTADPGDRGVQGSNTNGTLRAHQTHITRNTADTSRVPPPDSPSPSQDAQSSHRLVVSLRQSAATGILVLLIVPTAHRSKHGHTFLIHALFILKAWWAVSCHKTISPFTA